MRSVVRTEHIDNTLIDALPYAITVTLVTDRRVHLDEIAERLVIVCRQGEMMRRCFARRDILVIFQEVDFFGCGDMQYVNAGAGIACDAHKPFRALKRCNFITPDRMARRITLHAQAFAFLQPELVF